MKIGNGNPFLLAIVAACALGTGVMGTLLWKESRPTMPAATTINPVAPSTIPQGIPAVPNIPASPNASAAPVGSELPPPPSTMGMTPAEAALTLGNWYYDSQQWPQAIERYRYALTNGLDNPNVRTDYGNSLRFSGQPQKALEQYKIAQKQDPNHEQSLFNQGGLWAFALGNNTKAVAAWRQYLKNFPEGQSAGQAREFIAKYQKK